MDHRIALKSNTQLRLCNDNGETINCVIENEIGRGGSCIVYEASRITNTGDKTLYRIKEFYPYNLNISRSENNVLIPSAHDAEVFNQKQAQLRTDFSRTNQLFYSDSNYSAMTNQLDVFRQNGTSYVLSTYSSKKTLATYTPETLKECIIFAKQVAYVLCNIHKQGYLYLDTKPDNVLIIDGYQKQVQLFDFNSLFKWKEAQTTCKTNCNDTRLSYTKGFAPIELQTLNLKHIGPHTDVYGVGALLFQLLFGYTPSTPNCEPDAVFDFTKIKYDYRKCDCKLFRSLSCFFHKALAVYYADRYQSMLEVLEKLEEIEMYADPMIPRIYSTQIATPKICHGREYEFEILDKFLTTSNYNCLFIKGMGGIGKSTFIRKYLTLRQKKFDTILYVHYNGSIEATISNDSNIEISTLRQDEEIQDGKRYFDKKIDKIRELVRETFSVLVIDNFTGEVDDDLKALLSTELKVILLSRKDFAYQNCQKMELTEISDSYALRRIFEDNLGRSIEDKEYNSFEQILKCVNKHTLILELIAKQIANSHITISNAAAVADEHGFSAIAPEKVDYEQDSNPKNDTIENIIDALFEANTLSKEKRVLMKVASLLSDEGIDINYFQQIMQLSSKDDLNELINDGWLSILGDIISMHNVIQETVHRWKWTPEDISAAEQFLTHFYVEIHLESTKNNYPKKLRNFVTATEAELPQNLKNKWVFQKLIAYRNHRMKKIDKLREKMFDAKGLTGKVTRERYARIYDESPADINKLTKLLFQAEGILKQCCREKVICDSNLFTDLQFIVLLNMPRYREDFIFSEASLLLTENAKAIDFDKFTDFTHSIRQDAVVIMRVYELVFSIHAAHRDKEAMKVLLDSANKVAKYFHKQDAFAIYYNMVSDYYDILLDGAYKTITPDEEYLLNKMLDAIEKTLHYSKRGQSRDINHLYAKNILAKATILIRSGRGTEQEISELITTAKKTITENTSHYADVRLQYYLVCAWNSALVYNNLQLTDIFIKTAQTLSEIIVPTDLQKIEEIIIPCADIFFELKRYNKAIDLLCEGIRFCNKHANTDSYAHVKQDLCNHLFEVGIEAQQFEFCKEIIKIIDAENNEIVNQKQRVNIPSEVRNIITERTI